MNLEMSVILLILLFLVIPAFLGFLVIGRMVYTGWKARSSRALYGSKKLQKVAPVPLLDEPMPCPTCERLEFVHVARSNFQAMPYVEHFICHGCGTEFLGENQKKMVAKRVEARRKFTETLVGRAKKPETDSGN